MKLFQNGSAALSSVLWASTCPANSSGDDPRLRSGLERGFLFARNIDGHHIHREVVLQNDNLLIYALGKGDQPSMASSSSAPSPSSDPNVLLEYYKEQLAHGRHTEVQRSTVAGIAFGVSGAIIVELAKKTKLTREELPYTIILMVVGLLAWLLTAKLYERFRLHEEVARLARDALNPGLQNFRRDAEAITRHKHPLMFPVKLHVLWNSLFALVSLGGLIMTGMCFR